MKFIFDLDGTICFRGEPVSEKISHTLDKMMERGHEVIFASARPVRDMLPVLPERYHRLTLIGGNGALISQQGRIARLRSFTDRQIQTLLPLMEEHEVSYIADGEWDYAYRGPRDHPFLKRVDPHRLAENVAIESLAAVVKILIMQARDRSGFIDKLQGQPMVIHHYAAEDMFDLSPQHIDKGKAIAQLGIKGEDYIAFGNDSNDLTMFQQAAHAVMIGHHPELAIHATEQIPLGEQCEDEIVAKLELLARETR